MSAQQPFATFATTRLANNISNQTKSMTHIATPFDYAGAYRGMSCSCGEFTSSTGIREQDEIHVKRHINEAKTSDLIFGLQVERLAKTAQEMESTIKMLLDRLHDRTQGMLARQVKLMDTIRKLEREKRGWQPIATAPRDGTRVLCYSEYSKETDVLEFHHGCWLRHADDGNWGRTISHWMPNPPAPQPTQPTDA